jgi:hypothetical protein
VASLYTRTALPHHWTEPRNLEHRRHLQDLAAASISFVDPSPPPKPSPVCLRVVSKTPLPPFTLPRAVALASARRRQLRRPLAVRAAVAARDTSL